MRVDGAPEIVRTVLRQRPVLVRDSSRSTGVTSFGPLQALAVITTTAESREGANLSSRDVRFTARAYRSSWAFPLTCDMFFRFRTAFMEVSHMIGTIIAGTLLIAGLFTAPAQAVAQATPADAAPFLGDWTLEMQGPNGPGTFDLTVKVEKEKVGAEIKSEQMPLHAITDVTKSGKSLYLSYSFDYEGNAVSAVVSLTPAAEGGKTTAQIDFAGGAYVMTGVATKKEKAK
jgi:hypothetical protein